ncbi:hypothetical protein [Oricola indica]|uniref:hypothetical protein n=1 Tax=Oricola indica TaxID=2872591 RepID=UPI003CCBC094
MEALRRFTQTTSEYSSEIRRIAYVVDVDRFFQAMGHDWKEEKTDFAKERAEISFATVEQSAREHGYAIVEIP